MVTYSTTRVFFELEMQFNREHCCSLVNPIVSRSVANYTTKHEQKPCITMCIDAGDTLCAVFGFA